MKCKENASEHREKCTKNPNMCLTYKEGPLDRANRGSTEDAREDKDKDPRVSQHVKDKNKRLIGGVSRTCPAKRPGASREGVTARAPDYLPYVHLAGTAL